MVQQCVCVYNHMQVVQCGTTMCMCLHNIPVISCGTTMCMCLQHKQETTLDSHFYESTPEVAMDSEQTNTNILLQCKGSVMFRCASSMIHERKLQSPTSERAHPLLNIP